MDTSKKKLSEAPTIDAGAVENNDSIDTLVIVLFEKDARTAAKILGQFQQKAKHTVEDALSFFKNNRGKKHYFNQESLDHALRMAAFSGEPQDIETLMRNGAKLEAADKNGYKSIHYAALGGKDRNIRLLAERRVDVDAPSKNGIRPIHIATIANQPFALNKLLAYHAQIDAMDKKDNTAAHYAFAMDNLIIKAKLINNNADLTIRNRDGVAPIDYMNAQRVR